MKTQSMEIEPRPRFAEWLIAPMRRNRATFIKVALAAAMINIFGLVTSLFTMVVYDRVVPNNAFDSLIALTIGLAIVVIFDFALRLLRSYFVDHAGANIDRDVGEAVFARLMAIRLELKTGSTGALTGLMRELETLREFFTSATLVAVVDVPFILLTLGVIALIGGPVVFVPLTMVPLVMLAGYLTHPAMDRLSASAMKQGFLKQGVLVEAVSGLETVKSIGAGPLLARRWTAALDEHSDVSLRQRLVGAIATTVAASANTISFAGVIIVGVNLIAEREMTPGALIACSILAGRAIAPLAQVAQLLSRIAQTRSSYKQLAQMMALPPEGPAADALTPARVIGAIEFRNVDFRYPGATEKALDNVSFSIKPGERVALLGRIGCGKSTIGRLLLGLYPAESGVVLIDGSDVRQFDPALLRASIGAALQDNYLVSGSVRENIALERPQVDDEELLRASNVSGTHQFIGQITNGYDLKLADRGEGLSGGQRQSISIARALAGRPPILLLDEPTSAMDNQTENGLIDRLAIEMKGRTLVLITHRPQMLKLVDRIILIDRGKVMADGPREKVIERLSGRKAVVAA